MPELLEPAGAGEQGCWQLPHPGGENPWQGQGGEWGLLALGRSFAGPDGQFGVVFEPHWWAMLVQQLQSDGYGDFVEALPSFLQCRGWSWGS